MDKKKKRFKQKYFHKAIENYLFDTKLHRLFCSILRHSLYLKFILIFVACSIVNSSLTK